MSNNSESSKESINDVVNRLRNNRKQVSNSHNTTNDDKVRADESDLRVRLSQRASKKALLPKANERNRVVNQIVKQLLFGELTQGQALKELRINVLGLKQDIYAKLVDVSRKTLSDIENDRGNYKTDILDKVFKPFGLKVGLIPSSSSMLNSLLNSNKSPIDE
ncbi:helix-turn-helix domain-containing protein [Aliivibrio fischeri]|uniref:helix-turn-helix transcriptional regulator n=1 Tax=Aliivibrio fischeri TaxID=668 RepID=UPI001F34EA87|nr:helix-turn-helix transcriptional regulator [Aliivibrio fischeri]MCE7576637.1 helix-turn-helix domain-containing protein [Aliivibrio fischeri]MCE7589240.1 helix-turn-helix domain-containing protein [Aliivibrio fischeri]